MHRIASCFASISLLALTLAVGACSATSPGEEESTAESGLRALGSDEIVGVLRYGQTSAPVSYVCSPRFRAFSFVGKAGDRVTATVHSTNGGNPTAWLVSPSFANLSTNEGVGTEARVNATLASSGTHYVVFREKDLLPGTFTVSLQGAPVCNADEDPECTCEQCHTPTPPSPATPAGPGTPNRYPNCRSHEHWPETKVLQCPYFYPDKPCEYACAASATKDYADCSCAALGGSSLQCCCPN